MSWKQTTPNRTGKSISRLVILGKKFKTRERQFLHSLNCFPFLFSSTFLPAPLLSASCRLWTCSRGLASMWTAGSCCRVESSPTRGQHVAMPLRRTGLSVPMALGKPEPRRSVRWSLRTSMSACTGRNW